MSDHTNAIIKGLTSFGDACISENNELKARVKELENQMENFYKVLDHYSDSGISAMDGMILVAKAVNYKKETSE